MEENINLEFFQAINANREELARAIVKAHPDVDINAYGALHWAAQFQRYSMVDLLLSLGADLDSYKLHESTPLILVMNFNGEKKIEYMKKVLNAGAKADLGKRNGETPLFSCYDVEAFNLLVEYGANVNAISPSSGWSLLMVYTEAKRKDLVNSLLKNHHFTLINHCDKYGYSALLIAVERGFDDIMRLLIENGADVNLPTPSGRSIYEIGPPKTAAALRSIVAREQAKHEKATDIPVAPVTIVSETPIPPSAIVYEPPSVPSTPKKKKSEAPTAMKSQENAKPAGLLRFFRRSSAPSSPIRKDEPKTIATPPQPPLPTADAVVTSVTSKPTTDEWKAVLNRIEALEHKVSAQEEELQSLRRLIRK